MKHQPTSRMRETNMNRIKNLLGRPLAGGFVALAVSGVAVLLSPATTGAQSWSSRSVQGSASAAYVSSGGTTTQFASATLPDGGGQASAETLNGGSAGTVASAVFTAVTA